MSSMLAGGRFIRPMRPRDPWEPHRVGSPLELLTDLCYVVAVAQAGAGLHHGLVGDHPGHYVLGYLLAFFAVWWSWVNFAWFGSAYDNDDLVYRLLTILQIVGVLVLAAGVDDVFDGDFRVAAAGYLIMRAALIMMWLRAARADPERRATCRRYALGIAFVQVGWVLFAFLGPFEQLGVVIFVLLAAADICVPMFAERTGSTTWHPQHIADRYGAFFIIVLGESILAATLGVHDALAGHRTHSGSVILLAASGIVIVFSVWWLYFSHDAVRTLERSAKAGNSEYVWGFGHYVIFTSAAAIGAGITARLEYWAEPEEISAVITGAGIAVPTAAFIVLSWLLHLRQGTTSPRSVIIVLAGAVLILGSIFTPYPEAVVALVLAALLAVQIRVNGRERR